MTATGRGRCKACDHPQRAQIDLGLANGISVPALVRRFGVSRDAAYRHKRNHLPPQLLAQLRYALQPTDIDLDALTKSESEGLLQNLVAARADLWHIAKLAQDQDDLHVAVNAHGRLTKNLELTAKLCGELRVGSQTTINTLIVSPEYMQVRSTLLQALKPYPEAARAVSEALQQIETAEDPGPPVIEAKANGEIHVG